MPYRLADHTADLAIEATAPTREAVLAEAALALTHVLAGRPAGELAPATAEEAGFQLDAPDAAALAVAFLSELLWLSESRDLLWLGGDVQVEALGDGGVRVRAKGRFARHDPATHGRGVEVKAVTYHGLRLGPRPDGAWELWVLLDV